VKNPLNAMALHLDLLRAKAERASNGQRAGMQAHIEVLSHEIERLDRVVRTFLDFSRPVELQLKPADLSARARGVAQLAEAEAESLGIEIVVAAPQPGPQAWIDRDLIEQALLNLVNNGLQAMQPAAAGRQLALEVGGSATQAHIRIRDQGPGVPPEHRDKIFDLYFTTRASGTGIGLAMAARTMQLHHGSLELEDALAGAGASFVLRFPRHANEDAA
ncbi:MAG: sensor histidine kinase, partial [Terriglobales bacterium]